MAKPKAQIRQIPNTIKKDYLGIDDFHYSQNTYSRDDKSYSVIDLIELSNKLEPFDLPIAGIDISVCPWNSGKISIKNFAYHMKRVQISDLKHPIILDNEGFICDGWHRLVKAIIIGDKTIKAIRLTVMPDPL